MDRQTVKSARYSIRRKQKVKTYNNNDWSLDNCFFDNKWLLTDYKIGMALLYYNGYADYDTFVKSYNFENTFNYNDFMNYINRTILEENPIDFETVKKKYPRDEDQDGSDEDYRNRVISEARSDAITSFIDDNFPKSRVWITRYGIHHNSLDSERILDYFTFAHWITTEGFKKYIDEREKFYSCQMVGFIHKKPKYPVYLKIVQDVKSKLPELIERVKSADKNYFDLAIEDWLLPMCNRVYKSLVDNYSKILDLRDWKNLDLVIFAIETHRAENIKEALSFVDSEIRMKRLASLIENATSAICNTISTGIASLQDTMIECCNSINAHISAIGNNLSVKLDRAISATDMSNALLSKANVSSERLLNQVTSIKEIIQ